MTVKLPNSLIPKSFPKCSHIIWIICACIALRAGYYWASDGFSLHKIQNTFPIDKQWHVEPAASREQKLLKKACNQPFYYLAKGSQAYAFVSADGQYVLKLFKCYHLSPVSWLAQLPLPENLSQLRNDAVTKRQKKIDETLASYKLAASTLRAECGLVAMQILPNPNFHQPVTIVDKIGRSYTIDLGNYGFIVQRKADLIYPSIAAWIANKDMQSAKQAVSSIVALLVQRSKKGIQDSDPDLHKNAGLIGSNAIFIDLGSFHENRDAKKSTVYTADLLKITNNLKLWLQKQSPILTEHLEREISQAADSSWRKPSDT